MPAPAIADAGGPILRFAPSPNGRLHLGHAYSALLNARIAERLGGTLLLRIEDIDPARSRPALITAIHDDLAWLGLRFDGPVRCQSEHLSGYADAVKDLASRGLAYPCFCSRGAITARIAAGEGAGLHDPDGTLLYPGTCRALAPDEVTRRRATGALHTWRLDMTRALAVAPEPHRFVCLARSESFSLRAGRGNARATRTDDLGKVFAERRDISADPARWGDAVIARRDVPTSYHLAVVLDDHAQSVTHVVRGRDLEAATDLHVLLQSLLGLRSPAYHHHDLVRGDDGRKLAKSKGSETLADLRAQGVAAEEVRTMLGF